MAFFAILKTSWSDPQARILYPGLMLAAGAAIAVLPTTGGRLICDQGMCVQERTAALGTVRDAIMYPTSELQGFRIERGIEGELARVVVDLQGQSEPLTVPFTTNERDVERIAMEGARFLDDGAQARFVADQEVQGLQSFYKPIALLLLLVGAALAGSVFLALPQAKRRV